MCAGRGIIHAEMPVHAEGQPDPRGLQLWVDLPKKVAIQCVVWFPMSWFILQYKMVDPSYQELNASQ